MSDTAAAIPPEPAPARAPDLWAEQLGYISGTVLAWGAVLVNLWPALSRLQTGTHIHVFGRDEGADVAATSYYLLALLVALGLAMLIVGATHVVARGFWFGRAALPLPEPGGVSTSDRVARSTYVVVHLLWLTALGIVTVVLFSALSALIARFLMNSFGWPTGLSRFIASIAAFSPLYVLAYRLIRRRRSIGNSRIVAAARRIGWRHIIVAYAVLLITWAVVIEFSYVAKLSVSERVLSRTADPRIVVSTELGGAVSHPAPARLTLIRSERGRKQASELAMTRVDPGKYVSVLHTRSLQTGSYEIALSYPHPTMTPTFPYFRSDIRRTVGFVIID